MKFKEDKMPIRKYLEPALLVVTDKNRKLIQLAAPYTDAADGKKMVFRKHGKSLAS